jgi:hypothetical protein
MPFYLLPSFSWTRRRSAHQYKPFFCWFLFFKKHMCGHVQVLFTRGDVPMPISELPGCVTQSLIISLLVSNIQISQFNLVMWTLKFSFTSQAIFYCSNRLVCRDISDGQESFPIPATNLVDNPPVPPSGILQALKKLHIHCYAFLFLFRLWNFVFVFFCLC